MGITEYSWRSPLSNTLTIHVHVCTVSVALELNLLHLKLTANVLLQHLDSNFSMCQDRRVHPRHQVTVLSYHSHCHSHCHSKVSEILRLPKIGRHDASLPASLMSFPLPECGDLYFPREVFNLHFSNVGHVHCRRGKKKKSCSGCHSSLLALEQCAST